jgi:fibronectin type 3 domain-containing protein
MRRSLLAFMFAAVAASAPQTLHAQSCTSNVPHVTGTWVTLPYQMPINPISATLMRDGKVLIVAGSENDAKNNSKGAESYRAAVWDPTGTGPSSIVVQNLTYDVFCSGTAALADGRALVVGGTSDYTFAGENRASFFDPVTEKFAQSQNMTFGRWYATATTLADGRVMAFSGYNTSNTITRSVEIYDIKRASGAGWATSTTAPFTPPLYPHLFVLPGGDVFFNGQGSGTRTANGWIFDPTAATWTVSAATTRDRMYGSSVLLPLLPPAYTPRVMSFGGGNPATSTTEIIDLSVTPPVWTAGPSMSTGRIQMNAVLLPNGQVLAEGGSVNNEAPNGPGKSADLYDPVTNTMKPGGTAAYSRLYHSVALLLPDATVMSMGSNPPNRGTYEAAIEIYTPPYLFDTSDRLITTNRPTITGLTPASGPIGYNHPFSVSYTAPLSAISSAVLVRLGSPTHSFDMEQRLIGLCGPSPQPACTTGGVLNLTTPPDSTIAPPGYYMLFILDGGGHPSKARIVQLSPFATAPPDGEIASPVSDVTITAGGSVNFGTSASAAKYSWIFPGGTPTTSTAQNPGNVVFNSPGIYTTSLTVIDAIGNSDPNPPTRTITVLPTTPDFSINVSPPGQQVFPGGSATFTVKVTPKSGFTGSVSLSVESENPLPTGVSSGGFSLASINGGGSSVLTMNSSTSTIPYAISLTITGTSGAISHTASTTLMVNLAPPASVSAVAGNGQVSLSWPSSVGASSYRVKRSRTSGGPYTGIACPTGTSYVNTGLTNGTTYYYVVSASFTGGPVAGGESADSVQASAMPQASPPAAPTGLTATPGNAQVSLSWTAATGATSYRVKRATVSGGPYTTVASPTATSFTNIGLTNGTTYYYVVTAVNGGGESGNSTQISATPQASAPAAPTGLTATPGNAQVALSWTASTGATSYNVKRATVSGGPYTTVASPTTTTFTNTGLTNGTAYYYVVTARNAGGESGNSNQASATPQASAPAAPTGLTAIPGNAQVTLRWTASTGATSYRVKRATVSGGPYTTVASPTTASYTNTGLTNGTTYYYVVTAVNSGGESGNSSQVSARPLAVAAPTGLTASSPSKHDIALRWTQSTTAGVTQNRIYRRLSGGATPSPLIATIAAATSFTNANLSRHTTYCYQVTAIVSGIESPRSAEVCARTR